MTERAKRLLMWVGYPALGLVALVVGAHLTFPYERLEERLADALDDYEVQIASVGPGWLPGNVVIEGLRLTPIAEREDEKPATLTIERVDLGIGLLALLGGDTELDVEALVGDGRVEGTLVNEGEAVRIDFHTTDLPLDTVPGLAAVTGGAPIKGGLEARFRIELPKGKWREAEGTVELTCAACTVGDGKTKVRPTAPGQVNAFSSEGFTLPRIKLGQVTGKVRITKGIACITTFRTKSSHGELNLDGGIRFADPFASSHAQLHARFKLTDEFRNETPRNKDFEILISTGARQPDGYNAYYARSSVRALRWRVTRKPPPPMRECEGAASAGSKIASRGTVGADRRMNDDEPRAKAPSPPASPAAAAGAPAPGVPPPSALTTPQPDETPEPPPPTMEIPTPLPAEIPLPPPSPEPAEEVDEPYDESIPPTRPRALNDDAPGPLPPDVPEPDEPVSAPLDELPRSGGPDEM